MNEITVRASAYAGEYAIAGVIRFKGAEIEVGACISQTLVVVLSDRTEAKLADFIERGNMPAGIIGPLALARFGVVGIYSDNPHDVLWRLASERRRSAGGEVVAVVGGNGKTTVTQLLKHVFRSISSLNHGTEGNQNNRIGVPLTLLQLPVNSAGGDRYCAVELGTSSPGEILPLASLVKPSVAVITNSHREHQSQFGTAYGSAAENAHVLDPMEDGWLVAPADDPFLDVWRNRNSAIKVLTFSGGIPADVYASYMPDNQICVSTPAGFSQFSNRRLMGDHSLRNIAAAAAGALAVGVSLDCFCLAASSFVPPNGRLTRCDIRNGSKQIVLIDDSYNANPDSVEAAIAVLASFPGSRLLILSDMAECGTPEREIHRSLGKIAHDRGIDAVWSIGQASSAASRLFGIDGRHFRDLYRALNTVNEALDFDVILVKGSRRFRLEHLVREIKTIAKQRATEPPLGGRGLSADV